MQPGVPRRRRARPVAGIPVDALLARSEDLAKGWLVALVESGPLDRAPTILAAELARAGPGLCEAVIRALTDDGALRRLEPGGALEPLASRAGAMAGATAAEPASAAVDALSAVLWSALRDELPQADGTEVAELAERLARVTSVVRGATLRRAVDGAVGSASAWSVDVLASEVVRARSASTALSLLLVELADADRVRAAEGAAAGAVFDGFGAAVRSALGGRDVLARGESGSRVWILARASGRSEAEALGGRVAEAVGAAEPWAGAPLVVSIGVAVLGEDGDAVQELIEAAEESLYAAAARGVPLVVGSGEG
jgi:GGDEF domain-containing protein